MATYILCKVKESKDGKKEILAIHNTFTTLDQVVATLSTLKVKKDKSGKIVNAYCLAEKGPWACFYDRVPDDHFTSEQACEEVAIPKIDVKPIYAAFEKAEEERKAAAMEEPAEES